MRFYHFKNIIKKNIFFRFLDLDQPKIVEILIRAGANDRIKNNLGQTPLCLARAKGNKENSI